MAAILELEVSRDVAGAFVPLSSSEGSTRALRRIIDLLEAGLNGSKSLTTVKTRDNAIAASGTITLATFAAGTVVLVNGVPFTAVSGSATAGNNEFDISGTDTADAAALAAAINASTTTGIAGVVTATSAAAVVTVTATQAGRTGNGVTIETLGVVGTGTVTAASVLAADTVTINGQALTAHATTAANNQFVVGATNAATATNIAACINTSSTAAVSGHVRAVARAAVVHIFSKFGGKGGNAVRLASSDGTRLAVSGARLTGGTIAQWEGVQASGTVTISSGSGTISAVINGVSIDVTWATSDDNTAALLAAAVNSSTNALVRDFVTASATTNVVTITATHGGLQGNAISLAAAGTGATASGTALASGAVPTTAVFSAARLASGANDTGITYNL